MVETSVSVIIPVKDDDRVFACVESVLACAEEAGSLEIIVVDNGSEPAFRARLEGLRGRAMVLDEPRAGAYAARNRGLAATAGEVIAFTDSDCVVRPGWIAAALAGVAGGVSLVQGYASSVQGDRIARLVQLRYGAYRHDLREGSPTLADTRNLAVRRAVFDVVRFDDRFRRGSDTRFGLEAELRGFRIAYVPGMRVDHDNEPDLALFVAKQVCHGWGARRMLRDEPRLAWHGGRPRLARLTVDVAAALPFASLLASVLGHLAVGSARMLERVAGWIPLAMALVMLTVAEKGGLFAGHLLAATGRESEPLVSEFLGRPLLRE